MVDTISTTCPAATVADADIQTIMTNGLITDAVDAQYNTATNTLTDVAAYVQGRIDKSYLKSRPQITGDGNYVRDNLTTLIANDSVLMTNVKAEYCYYHARYAKALQNFLTAATTTGSTDAQAKLEISIKLNRRVNAMLSIMDYIGRQRVGFVNDNQALIDSTLTQISGALPTMQAQANKLNEKNAIINTQQEMMRFTQEKNNYIRNQISLWASLNILAVGLIFYVYRRT